MSKNPHAVSLGRKGGKTKTEKKSKSSAKNLEKARLARKEKYEMVYKSA